MPEYDLCEVKEAAKRQDIEYRGRNVFRDVENLGYELADVAQCLMQLSDHNHNRTIRYDDGSPPDDEYLFTYVRAVNDEVTFDDLYIKFCLIDECLLIDLGSFHLQRF